MRRMPPRALLMRLSRLRTYFRLRKGYTLSASTFKLRLQRLEAGFKVEKYDRAAGMYTCIPKDFPRCRIMMTEAQHQEQLQALITRAEIERRAIADGTMPPP